jgi:hydroxypyruvate reductase
VAQAPLFPAIELALIGVQQSFVVEELQRRFTIHPVYAEDDPFAALARVGSRVRGAVGHGMAGLTRRHLELMPKLEICAIHGVGLETSDLPAIRERGVTLTTTPVLFDDVADLAIALALACCRQIPRADRFVRDGLWGRERLTLGR